MEVPVSVYNNLTSRSLASSSAVIAFWKSFERSAGANPPPLQVFPRQAKVNDLPTELLLIIFKLVYAQEIIEACSWSYSEPRWIGTDLNSSSLFPYAIAAVCSRWRDAMSLLPECWTRVVIVIDLVATTLHATVLSWSRNLSLEVIVTRLDFDHAVDVRHEQDQVVSVMRTLVPSHVDRSRKLHINIKFSSSLPPFPGSFQGGWSNLSELLLQCQEDNGDSADMWGSVTAAEHPVDFPTLIWLVLDGRNYYNASRKDSQWTARCPSMWDLAISHYKPRPGESFSSADFILPITTLPSFGTLRINDVSLNTSPSTLTGTLPLDLEGGDTIKFSDMHDFQLIADMLDLLSDEFHITLSRCALGHPRGPFNWDGYLYLHDIEADEDLLPLLRCWEGGDLYINNCPSFNDAILDLMGTVVAGAYCCAPRMGGLVITNCPNFSVGALKRLVSSRLDVYGGLTYPGISKLSISGSTPYISTEDQQQISQHVDNFSYNP